VKIQLLNCSLSSYDRPITIWRLYTGSFFTNVSFLVIYNFHAGLDIAIFNIHAICGEIKIGLFISQVVEMVYTGIQVMETGWRGDQTYGIRINGDGDSLYYS
jgi:hypothetical protein